MNRTEPVPLGIAYPEDRLPWTQTLAAGFQHVIAMFGGTVLGPLLMGFDTNVALLFSGIATLIFYALLRGRIPSYLGSSFSFIGAVIAVTGWTPQSTGLNPHIDVALSGIIAAGALYAAIGLLVMATGTAWIERLLPPVLTGTIVAIIGLNLAPVSVGDIGKTPFDQLMGLATLLIVAVLAVYFPPGSVRRRMSILIGIVAVHLIMIQTQILWGSGSRRLVGLDNDMMVRYKKGMHQN